MNDLQNLLDEKFQDPGCAGATMAFWDGHRIHTAVAGVLNTETRQPVMPGSAFQIGSITKVLTATIALQLVEEGRLELDTPIRTYLPEFRVLDPETSATLTLRHLLTHTSGLHGDFFNDTGFGDDHLARYVDRCACLPQVRAPSAGFSYSNSGYTIIGRLIELASGKRWDDVLKERLFSPLGMKTAQTRPENLVGKSVAIGHATSGDQLLPVENAYGMLSLGPAGSTPTMSASDLLTFLRLHLDGGVTRDGARLLSCESVREMQTPRVSMPLWGEGEVTAQGIGWQISDWVGGRCVGHSGTTLGQNAFALVHPEKNMAVVLLINGGAPGAPRRLMRDLFTETFCRMCEVEMPVVAEALPEPLQGN
jgi:CubicO group peptidase (beta-lactamase class C family)